MTTQNQRSTQYTQQSYDVPPPYQDQSSTYLTPGDDKHLYDSDVPRTPRRGSQESSAAESDYEPDVTSLMSTTDAFHVYDILHTKSHINARIVDASTKKPLFYIDNSSLTPHKPDVTLCRGSEKTDQVVGIARWSHMYSKHLTIGLGDPSINEAGVQWEEMRTESTWRPEWTWSVTNAQGQKHTFAWSRIKKQDALDVGGEGTSKLSFKNFKLVYLADGTQTGNGELLATFSSNRLKSWSKLGKLVVKVDGVQRGWGQEWETSVILSVMALVEMSRRRGRQRRSPGGGAGGP